MTIFELVKIALDELYTECRDHYGKGADEAIIERMAYLSDSYKELDDTDRKPIKYKDPATRFAYVYKYVAAHGDYVVQALRSVQTALGKQIFSEKTLRLTCVGGGPGSDIVGVLKYLADYKKLEAVENVTCYLLDAEQAWADAWTEIGESINSEVAINVNFQQLNVMKPDSWFSQKKFLKADLFTLSYFVSEVYALDEGPITEFWNTLFEKAGSGSLFLYVDNGADVFNTYFDKVWKGRGDITCIYGSDNEWTTPHYSEQASELSEYKAKFGHSPKLKSKISVRGLRKK